MVVKSRNLSGIFRARVEDNKDPLKCGRVRVRVPMIHGTPQTGIKSSSLPWASMCTPSAGYGYGSYIVPEVGEYVFVMFEDADSSKPVYIGSSYGSGSSENKQYGNIDGNGVWYGQSQISEVPLDAQRDEPTKKVIYKSPKGSSIEVDDLNGKENIKVVDPLGQTLKFESNLIKKAEHKRVSGDVSDNNYVPDYENDTTYMSRILLMDYYMNKLEMYSDECGSILSFVDNDNNGIVISPSADGIVVKANNSVIQIDKDGNIVIKGNDSVEVEAKDMKFKGNFTIVGS